MTGDQNGQAVPAADLVYALGPYVQRLKKLEDVVTDQGDKLKETAKQTGLAKKVYGDLKTLTEDLKDVTERLEKLEADRRAAKPLNLMRMDAAELAATIRAIGSWLDSVGVRYGLLTPPPAVRQNLSDRTGDRKSGYIRPCWYRHWDVLYELAWLYQAWHNAYNGKTASLRAVADWHDRYLNQTLIRINEHGTIRNCDPDRHLDPWDLNRGIAAGRVDQDGLDGFLAVLTGHAAPDGAEY